jgi:outer membrane lipoprotein SlyB
MSQNVVEAGHRFRNEPHLVETRLEEIVATFETHSEAERAVQALASAGFPVEKGAIVARGIHLVEQVTGRTTSWRAATKGAVIGAIAGAVVGFAFGTSGAIDVGVGLAFWGLLLGAIAGAVVGWACYVAEHDGPVFESTSAFRASTFDVVVTENAGEAARIVDEASSRPT